MDNRQYKVEAKWYPTESWTDWTIVDDYGEALRQLEIIKGIGACGRIVDKSGLDRVVKMLEVEYEKAKNYDYVKNPLAFALYAVWKKIDKEGKKR